MGRSSKNFSFGLAAASGGFDTPPGGMTGWEVGSGAPKPKPAGGTRGEFRLELRGGAGGPGGGALGVEVLLCVWFVGARSLGFTTSIGRSYGEVYPPLVLSTKLWGLFCSGADGTAGPYRGGPGGAEDATG